MARRLWILLLPALFVFGACGDDSKDSGSGTATTAAAADPADDQKVADDVVLKLADFPSGWTEDEAAPEEEEEQDPFDQCLGAEAKELEANTSAEAESADFSRGEGQTASSFAAVLESEANAEDAMDIMGSQALKDCFNGAVSEEIQASAGSEEGVTVGEVALKNSSFAKVGEETTAMQLSVPVSGGGIEITFYADLVFIRQGRVVGGLFLGNLDAPFPSGEAADLAEKMVARMKAA